MYRKTGQWFPHLVNGGKYFAGILTILFNYMVADGSTLISKKFYVGFAVFSTLYSFGWDILMDWDLMQGTKSDTKMLRDKFYYPKRFYYFSAVTNFFLRFAWALTLIEKQFWERHLGQSFLDF